MSETRICGMGHSPDGPDVPQPLSADLVAREWPGGPTVPVLRLLLAADTVEVCPCTVEQIDGLIASLQRVRAELEAVDRPARKAVGWG